MSDSDRDLTVSRIINAPRSAVWRAWKEPEHFEKWWAPAPVVTISRRHDFYPGGAFYTVTRAEDGTEHEWEGCFLELIENERIVFTDALLGGWRPNENSYFSSIITLEEISEGTRYTAVVLHKNENDSKKHAELGFEQAWSTCIEQLGKVAERLG